MKPCLFALSLALFLAGTAAAQDYTVTRTVFIPATYYVGDTVQMRISLHSAFAKSMSVPQKIPQPSWGVIQSMQLIAHENEPELHIIFVSYAAGTLSLPQINLGQVVLEGVNVYVTSTLPKSGQTNLAPLREQVTINGTVLSLIIQGLAILAIPAALLLGFIKGRPVVRRALHRRQSALPYRRLQKSLRQVQSAIEGLESRDFYIRVTAEVRSYLSDRLGFSALAATTGELQAILADSIHDPAAMGTIIDLFRRGDSVKFAGKSVSVQARMGDLHNLEEALRRIEQDDTFRKPTAGSREGSHVDA